MEQPTYQWSIFSSDRIQQWVVRADSFEAFLEAVKNMQMLLPIGERPGNGGHPESLPEQPSIGETPMNGTNDQPICPIHKLPMILRTGRYGPWHEHRYMDETGQEWRCNGERQKAVSKAV